MPETNLLQKKPFKPVINLFSKRSIKNRERIFMGIVKWEVPYLQITGRYKLAQGGNYSPGRDYSIL